MQIKLLLQAISFQNILYGFNLLQYKYITANGFSVAGIKAAMKLITGVNVGPARKPLKNLSPDTCLALKKELIAADLISQ